MVNNPPQGTPQIIPRLAYRDTARAIDWLTQAFGLTERADARVATGEGEVILTEMQLGSGVVIVGRAGGHDLQSPATLEARTQMVVAYVDDVAGHCTRAAAAGAQIVMPLEDQPWGDRRYEALDLEGHRWSFLEHLRDVPPNEWRSEVVR